MSGANGTAQELLDSLILVDEHDTEIGTAEKVDCHLGQGQLHRAFSVFLFNQAGELLIQQRSANKMLWPMYWANSCCSHPRAGESTDAAASRRIQEELGVSTKLKFLYKFIYHAQFENVGSEHEHCWVYIGNFDGQVKIDKSEIADYRFVKPDQLTADITANPDDYSPWFKLEWIHIREEFSCELP